MPLSNSPSGVTSREIDALCQRAYKSDHLLDCSRCLQEIHEYTETSHHRVNGQDVCGECASMCAMCGEWLDDARLSPKAIEIRFREHENDGKLSDPHCPKCAADWLIGVFVGEAGMWDSDDFLSRDFDEDVTRFRINRELLKANALPEQWIVAPSKPTTSVQSVKEERDAS